MVTKSSHEGEERPDPGRYECVEPELGDRLWCLDDPSAAAAEVDRLRAHVTICHACRLQIALDERLEQSLRRQGAEGTIPFVSPRSKGLRWRRPVSRGSVTLLAACLALVFLVPPRLDVLSVRGGGDWGIMRPVPGEVVATVTPKITWQPLEDARSYQVTIAGEQTNFLWQVETDALEIQVPESAHLPKPGRFRVTVSPIPAYLAPPTGASSWLRTGTFPAHVGYRITAAPRWIYWLGLLALAALAAGLIRRLTL
jgi:hypothetical protein